MTYQPDERIELVHTNDPYTTLRPGDQGAVVRHDDMLATVHINWESWFLSECHRFLAADGVAGVVSFADPAPRVIDGRTLFVGHVGTIYQSSNAVLTGRSTPRYLTVLPDGTSLSDRAMQISCGVGAGTVVRSRGDCAAGPGAGSAKSLDGFPSTSAAPVRHRHGL